ncbi:MAG TPA: mandelate racemase/muconate lactonizing enzyme family protein [Solirubrobacteraceae bacterium]|nr:mandelate racemase/muconate lactonizing enzyme family protein [Solirubrobacteraceae bacterium]
MRALFVSASGSVGERELMLLRLEDSAGRVGFGEAAPLPDYNGASVDDVREALEECRSTLEGADRQPRAELLAECRDLAVLAPAVAAIDLALWDLEGRRTGEPVWRLLGARAAESLEVNYTIAAADRAGAAAEAASARATGFGCVKAKVGVGDDAGRLAAVRAVLGPEVAIRLDANGAWSVEEARAALRALAPVGIELCEEPVRGLAQTRELAAVTTVPIALDETASAIGALDERVCDAVCLKIASCGGITGLMQSARQARAAGYDVYIASTLDGPLGVAAALHAAVVLRPARACGLATLALFADRPDPLPARAGRIAVPTGPGLGDGLMTWYQAL